MNAFNHTTNLYLLHLNNQENIFIYYMKRREFIGNTFAIGGLTSVIPISQLYSNVQKKLSIQNKKTNYDVIVIGVGSMGSSACYHIAKQGLSVLGLEQFDIPHEMGSHTGQSRIIRKAYFEHPNYVPLLERAYQNWRSLEKEISNQIYFKTGLLYFGPSNHLLIKGTQKSAIKYGIKVNELDREEQLDKFPQFKVPENYTNLIEVDAGFVTPERAILSYTEQALKYKAIIHTKEKTLEWSKKDDIIQVKTNKQIYKCKKLVLTAGAWTSKFSNIKNLNVTRQILAWAKPEKPDMFELNNFPCWTFADPSVNGIYYGFPSLPRFTFEEPSGFKFAHHTKGKLTDPDIVNRNVSKEEEKTLVEAIKKFIPKGIETITSLKTCLYTYSPDEDFILDFYNNNEDVVIASGFSGHGFKFASVIGEILSELVTKGKSIHPINFLKSNRFN
ncbi:MAG: N-methyl-L-tryptophan oxidase [Flavobacteriaceae bacterium]|nr:N-methyl-L-tryptophan oxidase [Flavobacteriaceae bacterium]